MHDLQRSCDVIQYISIGFKKKKKKKKRIKIFHFFYLKKE